jgi:hypothetical protein
LGGADTIERGNFRNALTRENPDDEESTAKREFMELCAQAHIAPDGVAKWLADRFPDLTLEEGKEGGGSEDEKDCPNGRVMSAGDVQKNVPQMHRATFFAILWKFFNWRTCSL